MARDRRTGPQVTQPEARHNADFATDTAKISAGGNAVPDVAGLLAHSDLLDTTLRLKLATWHDGYQLGHDHGRTIGRVEAEADMAASWRELAGPIAHPERFTAQRIRAAVAGGRRDAAEHERAFVARAYNTPDYLRTGPQRGTVLIYPPRAGGKR